MVTLNIGGFIMYPAINVENVNRLRHNEVSLSLFGITIMVMEKV